MKMEKLPSRAALVGGLRPLFTDLEAFSRGLYPRLALRPYQLEAARAVLEAVERRARGESGGPNQFAIVFSRQAGKDEMLAQLLAFLLNRYRQRGGQVVLAAPAARQAAISRDRLLERLDNGLDRTFVRSREGYIVSLGRAEARFLSASPGASVRGETAGLLLVANEAQDILPGRWDAVFDPMAASTNAPTLFLGTVWTARTLLARQMRFLKSLEAADGQRRVFEVGWREVARHLPAYGERVEQRIAQFGPDHPFIRTEYELKELDGSGGLFGPERRALLAGTHPRREQAEPGKIYALLVDVAGEDQSGPVGSDPDGQEIRLLHPRRDSTAITVVEVRPDPAGLPSYRVVQRYAWTGFGQAELYGRLLALARETWQARYVVVDATGIGAGLASFLQKALDSPGRTRVLPFVFSPASKSDLGWRFCGIIDSGRFHDYAPDGAADTEWWQRQLAAVEYEVRPGPGRLLRWAVPDPALHDDLVMSAALVAVLDKLDWRERRAVQLVS